MFLTLQAAEAEAVPVFKKSSKGLLKRRPKSVHNSTSKNEPSLAVPSKKFWRRHRRVASDTPSFEYIPVSNEPEQTDPPLPPPLNHSVPGSPDHPLMAALVSKPHKMLLPSGTKDDNPPKKPPRVKTLSFEPTREKIKDELDGPSLGVNIRRSSSLDALNGIKDSKLLPQSARRISFEVCSLKVCKDCGFKM